MKHTKYEYSTSDDLHFYEFLSKGTKGEIKKVVEYSRMNVDNFYNLAFGDYDEENNEINDQIVTNNGDSLKVLATVASTAYAFTGKYPKAWIFATGSTEVRTRLYRMGITNNLIEIEVDFYVFGLKDGGIFEDFVVGEDYLGFLLTRRQK